MSGSVGRPITIYLCGGIMGLSDSEAKDWRTLAKMLLDDHTSYHILDPMARDCRDLDLTDAEIEWVVKTDHADIRQSDVLLVNATRPSWGTAMEVYFAASLGKKIFAVCGDRMPSIWLKRYATTLFRTFGGAVQAIQDLRVKA